MTKNSSNVLNLLIDTQNQQISIAVFRVNLKPSAIDFVN